MTTPLSAEAMVLHAILDYDYNAAKTRLLDFTETELRAFARAGRLAAAMADAERTART